MKDTEKPDKNKILPKTVDEAVKQLLKDLPIRAKHQVANASEDNFINFHFGLGMAIRNDFGLWQDNEELMNSCREIAGDKDLHVDSASTVIIKALWEYFQKHPLPRIATKPGEYAIY